MNCFNSEKELYECKDNKYPLAMAYVPWQEWKNIMCAKEGFKNGTIYSDLVLPFYGCKKGTRG
jgi:hypothetical protein